MYKGDFGELKNWLTSIKKAWEQRIVECRFKARKTAGRIRERNSPCGIRVKDG